MSTQPPFPWTPPPARDAEVNRNLRSGRNTGWGAWSRDPPPPPRSRFGGGGGVRERIRETPLREDQVEVLRVVGTVGGQGLSEAWREGRPSPAHSRSQKFGRVRGSEGGGLEGKK